MNFPQSDMPLSDARRKELVLSLSGIYVGSFEGSIADLFQLGELYAMRIGCDDAWLLELARKNHCL